MIHPSYTELMEVINEGAEIDDEPLVTSRYSVVLATSKRARQLIAGAEPLVPNTAGKKPLSIAIDELYKGEVKIVAASEAEEDTTKTQTVAEETVENIEETTENNQ